jgi:two-component system, cell cycle sensor histidine kinase and response regulator CckA
MVKAIVLISATSVLLFSAAFLAGFTLGAFSAADMVIVGAMDAAVLLCVALSLTGCWRPAAWILSCLFLLLSATLTYRGGGRAVASVYFSLTAVLAITLLGRRSVAAVVAACMATYLAAALAHGNIPAASLIRIAIAVAAPLTGVALLLRFSWGQLERALAHSRATAAGLENEVAERRGAETALRESLEKIRALFQTLPDGVSVLDLDGNLIDFNDASALLFAVGSREAAIGRSAFAFVWESERARAMADFAALKAGSTPVLRERCRMLRDDGTGFEAQLSVTIVRDAAGAPVGFVTSIRDISTQLDMEAQLRQAQKMDAIGQLAGGVAHDFNNMLLAVEGYTDLALQRLDGGHPARGHLGEVMKASERAGALVRQLLAFSRSDAMRPRVLDVNEVIRGVRHLLSRLLGERVVLDLDLPALGEGVFADLRQLEQVLVNLCLNARDAMPAGGHISITTGTTVLDAAFAAAHPGAVAGRCVRISVADTGTGMSREVREHLFEPFFTTKRPDRGTGLGLATVYGIIMQHNGVIECETAPGAGTRFHMYLPVSPLPLPPAAEPPRLERERSAGSGTILVAEDDETVRRLACLILGRAGYATIVARDGEEAVRVFRARADEVDMALIDVVMPGLNGRAVAAQLRARRPSLPILFTSGYDFRVLEESLDDSEQAMIIHKPYLPQDLLRRVGQALGAAAE